MVSRLLEVRYFKPIAGLIENWGFKLPFSILTSLWAIITEMFNTNIELVLLLILAIAGDLIVGIMASKAQGFRIQSIKLRQTVVKVIEYSIFLGILIGVSNVFGKADHVGGWVSYFTTGVAHIEYVGFFYAIFTELQSIGENSKYAGKLFRKVKKEIKNKVDT